MSAATRVREAPLVPDYSQESSMPNLWRKVKDLKQKKESKVLKKEKKPNIATSDEMAAANQKDTNPSTQKPATSTVDLDPNDANMISKSGNLISERQRTRFKPERMDPEKQKEMLDMGIKVIGLCQSIAEMALPKPVSIVLQKVAEVLGVLKVRASSTKWLILLYTWQKIVENKAGWKELIETLDEHQQVFNKQLERMQKDDIVPDSQSPLLEPIKQYST